MKRLLPFAVPTAFVALAILSGPCIAEEVVVPQSAWSKGAGVNGQVNAIVMQADGKVVLGGAFSSVNGVPRGNLARLNADGTLDASFAPTPEAGVSGQVFALALRPDGSILVGGAFTQAAGTERLNLALYRPDGSLDASFAASGLPGTNGPVRALAVQADGKVVLGGSFTAVFGQQRNSLARLAADGTLDEPLPATGQITGAVEAAAPLTASSTLAAGRFSVSNQYAESLFVAGNSTQPVLSN
jgi:uncharacterized delta-60 repeat protein